VRTRHLIVIAAACFTYVVPAAAQISGGSISQAFTRIDDVRANQYGICKTTKSFGDRDNPVLEQRCPSGPGGWPVTLNSADARNFVVFGRYAANGATVMDALGGAFADPHNVIEWRSINGRPFAAIQRYFFDGKQVLTVHRLNPDKTSCVAGSVAVAPGRDANQEAVLIADTVALHFRCGTDRLVAIGMPLP
jgi:hypothetical protein